MPEKRSAENVNPNKIKNPGRCLNPDCNQLVPWRSLGGYCRPCALDLLKNDPKKLNPITRIHWNYGGLREARSRGANKGDPHEKKN